MRGGEDWRDETVAVTSILVLGAGFVAMFLEVPWFWMIWMLGFTVFVPILAIVLDVDEGAEESVDERADAEADTGSDALETLRDRYARGELTDEQFERKLGRLLETETIEDLEDARRDLDESTAPAVEFETATGPDTGAESER